MKKEIGYDVCQMGVQMLGYKETKRVGVMTLKDGSRMTVTIYEFETPDGQYMVNFSKTKTTFCFESKDEMEKFYSKRINFYSTEKELYMDFIGMDEETWEEWNK